MLPIEKRLHTMFDQKIVVIIRAASAKRAHNLALALMGGGVPCVEVTMTEIGRASCRERV